MKSFLKHVWAFLNTSFVVMVFGTLIVGLLASYITDRWQEKQKRAELKFNLLKEFNDKSLKFVACMMAPRAMLKDRECLTVEDDLIMMNDTVRVVFDDKSLADDFKILAEKITETLGSISSEGNWVLSDQAFKNFRESFLGETNVMRRKMMKELGVK
jgi:hypothetical protein